VFLTLVFSISPRPQSEGLYQELHRIHARSSDHVLVDVSEKVRRRLLQVRRTPEFLCKTLRLELTCFVPPQFEDVVADEGRSPVAVVTATDENSNEVTLFLTDLTVVSLTLQGDPFGLVDVHFSTALQRHVGVQQHANLAVGSGRLGPVQVSRSRCLLSTGDPEQPVELVFSRKEKSLGGVSKTRDLLVTHASIPALGVVDATVWNPSEEFVVSLHRSANALSLSAIVWDASRTSAEFSGQPVGVFGLDECGLNLDDPSVVLSMTWSSARDSEFFGIITDSEVNHIGLFRFSIDQRAADPASRISYHTVFAPRESPSGAPLMCYAFDARETTLALGFGYGLVVLCNVADVESGKWTASRRFPDSPIHSLAWHPSADMLCVGLASKLSVVDRALSSIGLSMVSAECTEDAPSAISDSISLVDFLPRRSAICDGGCKWIKLGDVHAIVVTFGRGPVVLIRVRIAGAHGPSGSVDDASSAQIARGHVNDVDHSNSEQKIVSSLELVGVLLGSEGPATSRLREAHAIFVMLVSRLLELDQPELLSVSLLKHSSARDYCKIAAETGSTEWVRRFATLLRSGLGACLRARNFVLAFRFAKQLAELDSDVAWRTFSLLRRASEAANEPSIAVVCARFEEQYRVVKDIVPGASKAVIGGNVIEAYLHDLERQDAEGEAEDLDTADALRLGFWYETHGRFSEAIQVYSAHGLTRERERAARNFKLLSSQKQPRKT
jgi:hypothetical protein